MRIRVPLYLAALLGFSIMAVAQTTTPPAGKSWLGLIDQQRYADSWNTASTLFKSHVGEADWARQIKAARDPLGAVTGRKLASDTHATSLPGAPDGDYQVLKIDSRFAHKSDAIETLTLMRDGGDWRVAGYFIR
jgi:hypothetical protein